MGALECTEIIHRLFRELSFGGVKLHLSGADVIADFLESGLYVSILGLIPSSLTMALPRAPSHSFRRASKEECSALRASTLC